jgi:hypothetical protein
MRGFFMMAEKRPGPDELDAFGGVDVADALLDELILSMDVFICSVLSPKVMDWM